MKVRSNRQAPCGRYFVYCHASKSRVRADALKSRIGVRTVRLTRGPPNLYLYLFKRSVS